jgi:hypothetical protein
VNDELLARFSAAGTSSEVRRRIDELSSIGLDEIVLYPCIAGGQTKENSIGNDQDAWRLPMMHPAGRAGFAARRACGEKRR